MSAASAPTRGCAEFDLTGRTCIVTGANSGIGKEIARNLARAGAEVILACRNRQRGETALAEIQASTGSDRCALMLVDLSHQKSVREFAAAVLARYPAVHVLVNNAGIYPGKRSLSADGIELTWATNVLSYHLLAQLLLERLGASAPARIVNVASTMAGGLDVDDLEFERRRYGRIAAYKQSKQANRLLSWALAERIADTGVTVNVAHPGPVATSLASNQNGLWGVVVKAAFRWYGDPPEAGADTPSWLAADPALEGVSGKFFARRREVYRKFADQELQEQLWQLCEAMIR